MNSKWNDISKAVTLYLGFGIASSPERHAVRLFEEFGPDRGRELEQSVACLLDEVAMIEVDWSTQSLQSAGEAVRNSMQARHPDLSDSALRALEWKFTFDWR